MNKESRLANRLPSVARSIMVVLAVLCMIGSVGLANGSVARAEPLTAVIVLPDDGKSSIIDEIDAAQESIRLYLYLLSDDDVIRALIRAHVRGVDVRVMLEPLPYGGARTELETWLRLDTAGVNVRWSPSAFRFSHVKLMIVDSASASIMNLNMTGAAFTQNREFALLTTEPDVVREAIELFDADWNGSPPPDPSLLVVSPVNSRATLLSLFESATTSIAVYAEVLNDPEIMDALVSAVERGAVVRMMMSEIAGSSLWYEEPGFLARSGVDVRILDNLYVHAKAIIIDGQVLWIGSQNLTANSLDANREVGLITTETVALQRVMATFETDWQAAAPLDDPTTPQT
jgi:phosphatidylserine/phosphatidylglycerophosphate/cardiolipin synthase-like enzyme